MVRDLGLSKDGSELLASRLNEKHMLNKEARVTFYRKRDLEFLPFFEETIDFVYCKEVKGLLISLGLESYNPNDWRLFLDSSKRSLKCVLLHNTNIYASIPMVTQQH